MTPDWRDDVRLVRRAMRRLAAPAPSLLGGLAGAEDLARGLADLPSELSVMDVAPFAALPADPGASSPSPPPAGRRRGQAAAFQPISRERRRVGESAPAALAASPLGASAPATRVRSDSPPPAMPVFPLRRPGQTVASARAARSSETPSLATAARATSPVVPVAEVGHAARDAVAAPDTIEMSPAADGATLMPGAPTRPGHGEAWSSDGPRRRAALESVTALADSGPAAGFADRGEAPAGATLLALLADEVLANGRAAGRLAPEAAPARADIAGVAASVVEPQPGPAETSRITSATPAARPAASGDEMVDGVPVVPSARVLAALVNDALVEQARRHGVDLS